MGFVNDSVFWVHLLAVTSRASICVGLSFHYWDRHVVFMQRGRTRNVSYPHMGPNCGHSWHPYTSRRVRAMDEFR
ncbi:hypothetical protein BDY21DRAFT_332171 [Lineolata rhizophorae]|uniref:Uncharacterized protein n=1 Tax=Lineolata rhizophorae TaxID=578093 RepID=A0A6A6PC31_9PEZI|nr:hypothetical protein BDY21DRAFT_332171 [Lineolata rhizophorae]